MIDLEALQVRDERARFYLDHRAHIEEWISLRADASRALHECFADFLDVLAADALARGLVLLTADVDDEGSFPRGVIQRPEWSQREVASAPAGVAMEWESRPIAKDGSLRAYVCLRGDPDFAPSSEAETAFIALGATLKQQLPGRWLGSGWDWPCWQWLDAATDDIDELALLASARRRVWELWDAAEPGLDRLLGTLASIDSS